jgi:UDP-glucuronate 4-epimerase
VKVLVTGAAGFIGMHSAARLLERGHQVLGLDNLSPYYSVDLKRERLKRLPGMRFEQLDLTNAVALQACFADFRPEAVLHLAAQPGVRYSIENPMSYIEANIVGFANLIECCRRTPPGNLVFASSSSVYGANTDLPWSERHEVDHPVSLYAATKKSNELIAHVYSHLYGLHCTGLRYFTVYGPWGRPDMSPILFARAIMEGRPIRVFNHGDMARDFTYVDDIVEGTLRVLDRPQRYAVYNIGNHEPVRLLDYIGLMEKALGRKALLDLQPMQPGDVKATYADTSALRDAVGFEPSTPLETGLARFAAWFKDYYRFS